MQSGRSQLTEDQLKRTKTHARLYGRLIRRLKAVGLLDHVIDITFEETFKVLGKHLKKACLSLDYIESICDPLIERLALDSELRVQQLIEKELGDSVCDHIKRYSVVVYGYHVYMQRKIAEWTNEGGNKLIAVRNRKCLNRTMATVERRLGSIASRPPPATKVRHTYNRRKALKNKSQRKQTKQLQRLADKRESLYQRQKHSFREADSIDQLLMAL